MILERAETRDSRYVKQVRSKIKVTVTVTVWVDFQELQVTVFLSETPDRTALGWAQWTLDTGLQDWGREEAQATLAVVHQHSNSNGRSETITCRSGSQPILAGHAGTQLESKQHGGF